MKIMVLRDIERDEVEFICKVSVVNHILTLSRPAQTSLFINLLCQRKTILLIKGEPLGGKGLKRVGHAGEGLTA